MDKMPSPSQWGGYFLINQLVTYNYKHRLIMKEKNKYMSPVSKEVTLASATQILAGSNESTAGGSANKPGYGGHWGDED